MKFLTEPIVFQPLYMDRVWGGRKLESVYGRDLPSSGTAYGESWELVDREAEQSIVTGGEFDGMTLHGLWSHERERVFGVENDGNGRFPLLVKILDARDRLSIQVHPPEEVAERLGGEPKTEMWFIADAEEDAALYVGLKKGVTAEEFASGIPRGDTASMVHRLPAGAGDFIFIPSGRLHAIGSGLLIFEIQQNSDTTFRVFDWNRMGLDGKARDLHVEESMECIDFGDTEPGLGKADGSLLVDCPFFRVEKRSLGMAEERRPVPVEKGGIIAVVRGTVRCGSREFCAGDFFLLPRGELSITGGEDSEVLVATLP
ncbi:MAG: type I phosphomannose isomerase catalytic subunit [Verrucomicrobiota bacterium]